MIEKISKLGFDQIVGMIEGGGVGVVMCCTMNEVMMSKSDNEVNLAMSRANILTPDGMPLVWYLRWKNGQGERVYGPDILGKLIGKLGQQQLFIGDSKNKEYFQKRGHYLVLPFKDNFGERDYKQIAIKVRMMKLKVVWVGLGARKQVLMADGLKRNGVACSIVTVGAAFDFLSGHMVQAPRWVRNLGMEWLFRLICEPKRLGVRYLSIIRFVGLSTVHYLRGFVGK